jgi:hypothetical protein
MVKVDVAICVYGKPFNTAVTIASLLRHSGQHIGRVFIQQEREQPYGETIEYLPRCFPGINITQTIPDIHIGHKPLEFPELQRIRGEASYRRSVRYQFAWETSEEPFLFICHNDCLFTNDIIGEFLSALTDDFVAVGGIGQCWNCPARYADVCDGDRHETFQPTYEEAIAVVTNFPGPRTGPQSIVRESPMPFPECRLNEFACMINLRKARPYTAPFGTALPLGTGTMDTGLVWFREMRLLGQRFRNLWGTFQHAPFADKGNGHDALNSREIYDRQEDGARAYLREHYPEISDRAEVLRTVTRALRGLPGGRRL